MARGENPGQLITMPTEFTYSATTDFGHANAGKDLMLSAKSNGDMELAANDARLSGKFLDLDKDGNASVLIGGKPIIMRKSGASAIPVGSKVIGAGSGKVKASTNANASGYVLRTLEAADNGRILVLWEAGE